jgi:hypothetical protein
VSEGQEDTEPTRGGQRISHIPYFNIETRATRDCRFSTILSFTSATETKETGTDSYLLMAGQKGLTQI